MPKISDQRRAERRLQIIDAARACFDRQGPQATTMSDIIKESGLSSGAVYNHFKSKDELIVASLTVSLSGLRDLLDPLFARRPPPTPDELVREIAVGIVSYSKRDRFDLQRVTVQGWAEALRNESLMVALRSFYLVYRERLVGISTYWKHTGAIAGSAHPLDVAKTLLSLFLGFVAQTTILGDVEPRSIEHGFRDLIQPAGESASGRRDPHDG